MAWCEEEQPLVIILWVGRNSRLLEELEEAFFRARAKACLTGGVAVKLWSRYQTRESWSRARRVIGKAEVLHEKNNPRFIVTNLPRKGFQNDAPERFAPSKCYEGFYCPRGNMENEIKQQLLDLHADRTSTHSWPSINCGSG